MSPLLEAVPRDVDLISFLFGNTSVPEDRQIFVDAQNPARSLTKAHVRKFTRHLVAGWRKGHQVESGFTVCVHAFNDLFYPIQVYGIVGAGGSFAGSNPAYTASELEHHLRVANATFIITQQAKLPTVLEAAKACQIPIDNIYLLDLLTTTHTPEGVKSWTSLLTYGEEDWVKFDAGQDGKEVAAALFSTSGTTGLPKMAIRTHHSIATECLAIDDNANKPYEVKRLLSVPFFHGFGAPLGLTTSLYAGVTTYIMRRFDQEQFVEAVERFGITESAFAPPTILSFLASQATSNPIRLPSIKQIFCGGAPLDKHSQAKALSILAEDSRIVQVWGMTEAGWVTTFSYPEQDCTGSVGRLLPFQEAKIVGPGETILGEGEIGEVRVRGPLLMHSYRGNEEATKNSFDADGYLATGDVAFTKDGKFYIVDRMKDLIKVRAWQVSPSEIEASLLLHEKIVDAAVIGMPDAEAGSEIPLAFVVCREAVGAEDIRSFLLKRLARYKVMDCQFIFRDSIPKSASGKILRKDLRAEMQISAIAAPAMGVEEDHGEVPGLVETEVGYSSMSSDVESPLDSPDAFADGKSEDLSLEHSSAHAPWSAS